ncbi:hypothetical protein [Sphingomonas sp. PP-CC-3G-468]|uniref:hypothetical protein n=1 Tax=Sphingomonas sp. PP-CC-3G-468 TaxID=2135656 RepID=UPI001043C58A|nr:hypothetical protein [Sphingomonas sp. PP-CC-3G-468]TCM10352.1 hypothetical protein C8J41_101867 [Sphingomonas sp. PP-CC-3G-468]
MTDGKPTDPSAAEFKDVAKKSVDAGIADESAAYEQAIEGDDDEVAEGKWKSTDDGSGTSETD